ncbi:MAG: hypothetical protein ACREBF_02055 [Candidatus Micrarchaeales archaeon]
MRLSATLIALLFLLSSSIIIAQSNTTGNTTSNATAYTIQNATSSPVNYTANTTSNHTTTTVTSYSVKIKSNCNFSIIFNPLPAYVRVGNITLNYTLKELSPSCAGIPLTGEALINPIGNSTALIVQNLTANTLDIKPQQGNFTLNSSLLSNITYSATVSFTFGSATNSSSAHIQFLNPQNLSISALNQPFAIPQGSQITLQINTTNNGELTSGNFTLFLNISNLESRFNVLDREYNSTSLLPFQSTAYTITIPNATQSLGAYQIVAFEKYKVGNNTNTSNVATTRYSVVGQFGPGDGGSLGVSNPIIPIPSLLITTAPLLTAVASGSSSLLLLGFQNTAKVQEIVHLSVPTAFANFLHLSTSVLYISPKQQPSVQLFVSPNATVPTGTYVVPLKVDLNVSGTHTIQTEYFSFNIYTPSNDSMQVINQLTITNNSASSRGILQISNPTSNIATNVTLRTLIPMAVAANASDIVTTGLQATISNPNSGFYTITWQIPSINPATTLYAYYIINKPRSVQSLQQIQNVLAAPSLASQSSILKVVNIAFPTFYTNASNKIQIFALYTGTTPQPVTFTLTSPSGITISNFSQVVEAQPNQLLSPTFNVSAGSNQGTYLLNLFITTPGYSSNYTLPLIVLNSQQGSSGGGTSLGLPTLHLGNTELPIFGLSGIIVIVAIVIYYLRKQMSKPKYRRETSEQLVRLREQIKRSEDE